MIVESPYAGDIERNTLYARAAVRDCLLRGEAPFASHLLYTQDGVLDDAIPSERMRGIRAGLSWGVHAAATVVYTDLGTSSGMREGIADAARLGRDIEMRTLGDGWQRIEGKMKTLRHNGNHPASREDAGEKMPDLVPGKMYKLRNGARVKIEFNPSPDPFAKEFPYSGQFIGHTGSRMFWTKDGCYGANWVGHELDIVGPV